MPKIEPEKGPETETPVLEPEAAPSTGDVVEDAINKKTHEAEPEINRAPEPERVNLRAKAVREALDELTYRVIVQTPTDEDLVLNGDRKLKPYVWHELTGNELEQLRDRINVRDCVAIVRAPTRKGG